MIIKITAITEGKKSSSEIIRYFQDEVNFSDSYLFGERYEAKQLSDEEAQKLLKKFKEKYKPLQLSVSTPNGVFKSKKKTRYEFEVIEK